MHFNNLYGFGVIDADAAIEEAQRYSGVTPLATHSTGVVSVGVAVPEDGILERTFTLPPLGGLEDLRVRYSVSGSMKGIAQPVLISPSGMESPLVHPNQGGASVGTLDWTYLTNAFWGEDPEGIWTLKLSDLPWSNFQEQSTQVIWDLFEVTARYGSLIPATPGDFNADGVVDGSDFLVWQQDYGQTARLRADDNHDGVVDAADYTIWRDNFGQGSSQVFTAVPEPGSIGLIAVATATVLGARSRRGRQRISNSEWRVDPSLL